TVRPWAQGEIRFSGGSFRMGNPAGPGFAFEEEQPAHWRQVEPFAMDSTLVSHAQFAEFIEDGGYRQECLWSRAGRAWLQEAERTAPRYWRRAGREWHCLRFGKAML